MTAREAYEALERRRASVMEGLVEQADAQGGHVVLTTTEIHDAVRMPHVGLDIDADDLERVAEAAVQLTAVNLLGMIEGAAPALRFAIVARWLTVTFEDGYLVRALQEAGS